MCVNGYPSASLTRVSVPGWPYFGRTPALNAAVYCQMMTGIPGQTGIRAGDGCSGKFLRIKRLSNGQSTLREEQRAPSDSQHWLALLLPLVHLLKLLKNLVAELVHLRCAICRTMVMGGGVQPIRSFTSCSTATPIRLAINRHDAPFSSCAQQMGHLAHPGRCLDLGCQDVKK
jgi:hypothetical protein